MDALEGLCAALTLLLCDALRSGGDRARWDMRIIGEMFADMDASTQRWMREQLFEVWDAWEYGMRGKR